MVEGTSVEESNRSPGSTTGSSGGVGKGVGS